jgi:hypothetical protein
MKRIFLFIVSFAICIVSHAQLPNKLWGLTLGVSSETQVKSVCKSKGLKSIEPVDSMSDLNFESTKGFYFEGLLWKYVSFSFNNNKLSAINFDIESNRSLIKESDNFLNVRIKRFPQFYLGPDEYTVYRFADSNTIMVFMFGEMGPYFRHLGLFDINNIE